MDRVLGLGLDKFVAKPAKVPKEIQKLLDERVKARQNKDWKKSDELRDELSKLGWVVEDTKEGQKAIKKWRVEFLFPHN
jgi:cysteinyl-tRNA synthetase